MRIFKHSSPLTVTPSALWQRAFAQSAQNAKRPMDDASEEAFWRSYAVGYDNKSPLASCATEMVADVRALIETGWEMLEIGAGPGAFTRRLADRLSGITVVEPSTAMREEFARLWDAPQIVETLPLKWEDAPKRQADIVFGANAFYRMEDIAAALSKMNACARNRVALIQTIGRPHAAPLCVEIDGILHERERADALCDVLSELNIEHRRRDYDIPRPDGPSRAALIDWGPVSD